MAVQAKSAIDNGEDTARACLWVEESAMPFVEGKMKDLKIDVLDGKRNGELKYFWVSGSKSRILQLRQDLLWHKNTMVSGGTDDFLVKMEQMTPFDVYIPRSITATLYCNFKLSNVGDKVSCIMEKIYRVNAAYSSSTITYHISMVEAPTWNFTITGGLHHVNADQSEHSIIVDIDSDGFEDGHLGNPKNVVLQAIKHCDWVTELNCDVKQKTKAKSLK